MSTNSYVFFLLLLYSRRKKNLFFDFLATDTPKQEVKACYQCKGAEACKPERLPGAEVRTSAVLGAKNLYCYTVCGKIFINKPILMIYFVYNRNFIQKQVKLLLVVLLDLVNHSINILNAMLNIIYAAMKICATIKQLVPVLNHTTINIMITYFKNKLTIKCARAVCVCLNFLFFQ